MEQGSTYIPETAQWREEGFCGAKRRNLRGQSSIASIEQCTVATNLPFCKHRAIYSLLVWRRLLLLTDDIHTQLHTLASARHTHTYVHTIVSQSCWLHGCMLIMSSAVQYSYNSNISTCCGIHWMAKSTRTRQCLLSHVSSGTRTQLNAHLFREGIFFVCVACFHRDSLDALVASSGSQLQ